MKYNTLLVCIFFDYNKDNIDTLKNTINNINKYDIEKFIIIDTNSYTLLFEIQYDNIDIIVHPEPNFNIRLTHRFHMLNHIDNYDLFMFCDYDVIVSQDNITDYLEKLEYMYPVYIPCFEKSDKNIKKMDELISLNDKTFFSPKTYNKNTWIFSSDILREVLSKKTGHIDILSIPLLEVNSEYNISEKCLIYKQTDTTTEKDIKKVETTKRKVAICICGFIRNYEKCYQSLFDNIIRNNEDKYIFDIFISTWDKRNTKFSRAFDKRNIDDFSDIPINDIKKIFTPKVLFIETYDPLYFDKYKIYKGTNEPKSLFSQFYKLRQMGNILEDYTQAMETSYDFVIRIRFDIEIPKRIYLDTLDTNILYIEDEWGNNWASDKFSISNYKNFLLYTKFFNHIEELIKRTNDNVPEILLALYLSDEKVFVEKIKNFRLVLSR